MTQISNMKVVGLWLIFLKIIKLWHLSIEFYGEWQKVATHHRTQYLIPFASTSKIELVMELERPSKKLKLSILHAQDCWHFCKQRSRRLAYKLATSLMPKTG